MAVVLVTALAALCASATARAAGVFDVMGQAPVRMIVTVGTERVEGEAGGPWMTLVLSGVAAELEPRKVAELRQLATAGSGARAGPVGDELTNARRLWTVHCGREGRWAAVDIVRTGDGSIVARPGDAGAAGGKGAGAIRLSSERLAAFAAGWPRADARVDPGLAPGAQRAIGVARANDGRAGEGAAGDAARWPYEPSLIRLDQKELGRRLLNGRPTNIAGSAVDESKDAFTVRAPRSLGPWARLGCDAVGLPGVLVWIDAAPRARMHEGLYAACDELNLILIAPAECGNGRPTADRLQLAVDAVAAVRAHWMIDDERVYVSGISGGGKISTHLWAGFADVFAGAVPVVGLANYNMIVLPDGKASAADYEKPTDAARLSRLKAHRCGVMTGPPDFNYEPIQTTARQMIADGLAVRVFEYADMAHELPRSERFAEVLRWVDEPVRSKRVEAARWARKEVDAVRALKWQGAMPAPVRARLMEVTRRAAWSEPAWEALGMLDKRGR